MSLLISNSPSLSMRISRHRRAVTLIAIFVSAALVTGFGYVPFMQSFASFLIVEDALQPAAAIVALSGQTPFREMEAAKLYHAGWAPTVVIVREAPSAELDELDKLGIEKPKDWEVSRAVLIQQGVPPEAIAMPEGDGFGTLEELQATYKALVSQRSDGGEHGAGSMEPTQRTLNATTAKDDKEMTGNYCHVQISYAPDAAYLAVRKRRSFTAHRPRSQPGPLRSGTLVADARLRVVGRARVSGVGELLCGVPGRGGE